MSVIKRTEVAFLRNGAKVARKVLYAWDKACIDYSHWEHLKHRGIYFVTEEKSNSAAKQISIDITDRSDPRNEGIVSDYFVERANGAQLRRVVYTDPRDGTTYTYITNEMTLPAWAIVLMDKQRWNIEKVFHQFKSKMEESERVGRVRKRRSRRTGSSNVSPTISHCSSNWRWGSVRI